MVAGAGAPVAVVEVSDLLHPNVIAARETRQICTNREKSAFELSMSTPPSIPSVGVVQPVTAKKNRIRPVSGSRAAYRHFPSAVESVSLGACSAPLVRRGTALFGGRFCAGGGWTFRQRRRYETMPSDFVVDFCKFFV